jgi:hypothetical protein
MEALWELGDFELVHFCMKDPYLIDYLQTVVNLKQDYVTHYRHDLQIIKTLFWEERNLLDDFSVKEVLRPWLLFKIFQGNKVRSIFSSTFTTSIK